MRGSCTREKYKIHHVNICTVLESAYKITQTKQMQKDAFMTSHKILFSLVVDLYSRDCFDFARIFFLPSPPSHLGGCFFTLVHILAIKTLHNLTPQHVNLVTSLHDCHIAKGLRPSLLYHLDQIAQQHSLAPLFLCSSTVENTSQYK